MKTKMPIRLPKISKEVREDFTTQYNYCRNYFYQIYNKYNLKHGKKLTQIQQILLMQKEYNARQQRETKKTLTAANKLSDVSR